MALRVVFADDNYLVREGVAALLAEVDEIDLIETVADPHSLLKSVAEHRPEAVLTDIRMPPTHTTEFANFHSTSVAAIACTSTSHWCHI